jgi:hypothetical protein
MLALALGGGCKGEEKALPDPARVPKPEMSKATPLSGARRPVVQSPAAAAPAAMESRPLHEALRLRSEPAVSSTVPERSQRAEAIDLGLGPPAVAKWVVSTGDNGALPFVVIDKRRATVSMFDSRGRLRGAAHALLGAARGDVFAPGAAEKNMYHLRPGERITLAGRFMAERGRGLNGEQFVWLDYDAGVALHAVLDVPGQHRRQRLASPTLASRTVA